MRIPAATAAYQWRRKANCTCRALVTTLVIVPAAPAAAGLISALGRPKFARFSRLKNSERNCNPNLSFMRNSLSTPKSQVNKSRSDQDVAARVAECKRWRVHKTRNVEPLVDALFIGWQIAVTNTVGASEGSGVGGSGLKKYRERRARLRSDDVGHLPSACNASASGLALCHEPASVAKGSSAIPLRVKRWR